jgi:putative restriction endonuclease
MPSFFWVNQGGTHADEVAGGCLWAPERDANGSALVHWESMTEVRPGDIIFVYANGHLRGHATATSSAAPMARPYASGAPYSPGQGGRVVFCTYNLVQPPIPFAALVANQTLLTGLSSGTNPVLNSAGKVAQKYLCAITAASGSTLLSLLGVAAATGDAPAVSVPLTKTTVQQLVDARVGQGKFRSDLLTVFSGKCPITGLSEPKLLRASHIRPWSESSNADRLDPENGLLLAAGLDAAFDLGFVGFDPSTGSMLVRTGFLASALGALGIPASAVLPTAYLTPSRRAHLDFHRRKFGL